MAPPLVKLLVGFLFPDEAFCRWTIDGISSLWGSVERRSPVYPFDHTDYYRDISPVLYKAFVSIEGLWPADQLGQGKCRPLPWKKERAQTQDKR